MRHRAGVATRSISWGFCSAWMPPGRWRKPNGSWAGSWPDRNQGTETAAARWGYSAPCRRAAGASGRRGGRARPGTRGYRDRRRQSMDRMPATRLPAPVTTRREPAMRRAVRRLRRTHPRPGAAMRLRYRRTPCRTPGRIVEGPDIRRRTRRASGSPLLTGSACTRRRMTPPGSGPGKRSGRWTRITGLAGHVREPAAP